MHVCVASSHSFPVGHGNAGRLHPGTQPVTGSQRFPDVQVAGVHVETHVFVLESQVPPFAQDPLVPQVGLHCPSPESHACPAGHRCVVQSGATVTHCEEAVLQTEPVGQLAFEVHPALQVSESGSQYSPEVHPVIEQSGGADAHWPDAQTAPYPQSVAVEQPATQAPPEQCDPYGQPAAGQDDGGALQACVVGSQYWPP